MGREQSRPILLPGDDDALVRQVRVAAGAISTALDNVARMTPPPMRPPPGPSAP